MLILDDSSPDGTGDLAERLAARDPRVRVAHRRAKEGLGRAYVDGFRRGLAGGYLRIYAMDADLSHPPSRLRALREAATQVDLALGSRYVDGGAVDGWGLLRRLISRGGNLYARLVLGVPYRDLTGGFKCYRREVLEAIDVDSLRSNGYAFQIETVFRAHRKRFRIREVPFTFRDRVAGASKMSLGIILEAWPRVLELRWKALRGRL